MLQNEFLMRSGKLITEKTNHRLVLERKAFDLLLQQQIDKMKEEEIKAQVGEQDLNMEIVEDRVIDHAFKFTPNEGESAKINKEFEETEEEQK